jgi:hypothetical protein
LAKKPCQAIHHQRVVFDAVNGDSVKRMEHQTWSDEGDGGTGKGTSRTLLEEALGTHTGKQQNGYVAVITHNALGVQSRESAGEPPREQWANLEGSKIAFCDDFTADFRKPLNSASLRQIAGRNALTAARKGAPERTFTFYGALVMLVNGTWHADKVPNGADLRRYDGSTFTTLYRNNPVGPNQLLKDADLKGNVRNLLPEFFFLVRCWWLACTPHPKADITLPRPPSTLALIKDLAGACEDADPLEVRHVKEFVDERLTFYKLNVTKPSSRDEIKAALMTWLDAKKLSASPEEVRARMHEVLKFKPGHVLSKVEGRPRTSVNAVQMAHEDGTFRIATLKPPPMWFVDSNGLFTPGPPTVDAPTV